MPPKKQPALQQAESSILDAREVQIVEKLDAQVQSAWRLQRGVRQCLLGYAVLDLIHFEDKLKFGVWNSRPLKGVHVQRLQASFQQNGLERFDEKSVIPLVLDKAIVDLSSLTNDPSPSDSGKLPELRFKTSEDSITCIKCAGGRHRFEALKRYLGNVKQAYDTIEDRRTTLKYFGDEQLSPEDFSFHNKESVKELQNLGGILQYGGKWLAAVYDETSLLSDGIELAQYLSRNETKHVYMESDEERVIMEIQLLATLPNDKRTQRLKELRKANTSAKKANPLVTVVNTESAFRATELLVNHSSYFLEMPEMNVKWLYSELCGIHGGLMCAAVTAMADKLDLCFTDVVLKLEDVDVLFSALDDDASEIKQRMRQLRQAKEVQELRQVLPTLLQAIDEAWHDAVQAPATDAIGCISDIEYDSAYHQYVDDATAALSKHVDENELRSQIPQSLHPLIDSIPAKFKLVSLDVTSNTYGLPVLTRRPLVLLAGHFKRIPLALQEISRWLDPLVDYQVSLSKSPNSPYTQTAIDAIKRYDSFLKACPADELLLGVVLNDYGACLALEEALPAVIALHTQRVQTSKELAQVLPSRSDKDKDVQVDNDTTKKLRKRAKQSSQHATQVSKLQQECDSLTKAMHLACKPRDATPLKSRANLTIQGARLLLNSAWNWTGILSSSRSRDFHLIAGAAVLEFNIIAEYRDQLLESTPAAAVLRSSLAAQLQPHIKKPFRPKAPTSSGPDASFVFADQITPPSIEERFPIADALCSWKSCQEKRGDQLLIQKIVHAVERSPLAWEDPFSSESKSPALNNGVNEALRDLVNELEKNAYRKRSGDMDNVASGQDINLGIILRGCSAKTLVPTGQRGKNPFKPPQRKKLLPQVSNKVPTVAEADIGNDRGSMSTASGRGGDDRGDVPVASDIEDDRALAVTPEAVGSNDLDAEVTQSSPTTTQAAMTFEELYPSAQRDFHALSAAPPPDGSPSPDSMRHQGLPKALETPENLSVAAAVPSTSRHGSVQNASTSTASDSTRKRPCSPNETGSRSKSKKRVKGVTRFAQS